MPDNYLSSLSTFLKYVTSVTYRGTVHKLKLKIILFIFSVFLNNT